MNLTRDGANSSEAPDDSRRKTIIFADKDFLMLFW